jgi:hypothetical protein
MNKLRYIISKFKFLSKKLLLRQEYIFDKDVQEIVRMVNANGFAVIKNYYSEQDCNLLRKEIDKLIEKRDKENFVWKDPYAADYRCFGAEEDSEIISKFYNDKFLNSIANNYFKAKMACCNTLAGRIFYKNGNFGSGQGWHRDSNQTQFKALIYINDVDYKDGPFQLITASHKFQNILKHIDLMGYDGVNTRFTSEQVKKVVNIEPESIKLFTATAGTLIVFDSSTIHTGAPLTEGGQRYALTNYYMPSYQDVKAQRSVFLNAHKK